MKKLSILILTIFIVSTSFAQGISFGPRVGMNVSKLKGDDRNAKLGLNAGVFANAYLTNKIGLDVSVMFSQEGSESDISGITEAGDIYKSITKLNYLNVPVLLKYKLIGDFNVFAGPQFGIMLSAKNKIKNLVTTDIKSHYKNAAVSGVAGVGYTFFSLLDVNLNYNFMLNNINDTESLGNVNVSDIKVKGGTWQINFGIKF